MIKLKDRECVICHKMYTPRSGNQKVCSKACREIYVKKMTPIWNKKSYQKNKKKRKEYNKKHSKEQKVYRKDYYQKNKDRIRQNSKEWSIKNKEKKRTYAKKWYNDNKTYLKDYRKQRREKQIDDAFNKYHAYLQTLD